MRGHEFPRSTTYIRYTRSDRVRQARTCHSGIRRSAALLPVSVTIPVSFLPSTYANIHASSRPSSFRAEPHSIKHHVLQPIQTGPPYTGIHAGRHGGHPGSFLPMALCLPVSHNEG